MTSRIEDINVDDECKFVIKNIPYIQKLIRSDKITIKEKLSVLQDLNIDIAAFLLSIGESL